MSVEAEIVELITGIESVAELIGGRIAPVTMPDKLKRPNVVYQIIGARSIASNDGPTGLRFSRLQLSCYADDYETAKQLAAAIAAPSSDDPAGIDGFKATDPDKTIQAVMFDDERDAPAPPTPAGASSGIAGVILTFNVAHGGQ